MEPILHHYDISPYAEKVRLVFGLKGLAWRSVIQPMVLPKPELVPLTGGYRRIPVMQIGADVFCDTNLIAATLERLHPTPTLYPEGKRAETAMWCSWAERVLMWPTARYMTALNDEQLGGMAFRSDRAAMRGHKAPSHADVMASAPYNREQCRIMTEWLDGILSDGRHYLLGEHPGLADFAVYQRIWWLHVFGGKAADVVQGKTHLQYWFERVKSIGHGRRSELSAIEAHGIAATGTRDPSLCIGEPDASPPLGMRISIGTEDYAPDPVSGVVVASTTEAIAIAPNGCAQGIAVHFPRLGFQWRALD